MDLFVSVQIVAKVDSTLSITALCLSVLGASLLESRRRRLEVAANAGRYRKRADRHRFWSGRRSNLGALAADSILFWEAPACRLSAV